MESVLASLGQLLLKAIPTFVLVLILHFYLKQMFFGPLEKALKERKAATSGTKKAAQEALEKAEQKAAEYESKLRAARGEIYKEQEEARRKLRDQQSATLAETRTQVDGQINKARLDIENEKQAAIQSLQAQSEALSEQIATMVLRGGSQ